VAVEDSDDFAHGGADFLDHLHILAADEGGQLQEFDLGFGLESEGNVELHDLDTVDEEQESISAETAAGEQELDFPIERADLADTVEDLFRFFRLDENVSYHPFGPVVPFYFLASAGADEFAGGGLGVGSLAGNGFLKNLDCQRHVHSIGGFGAVRNRAYSLFGGRPQVLAKSNTY
jgi:hypothetical protein